MSRGKRTIRRRRIGALLVVAVTVAAAMSLASSAGGGNDTPIRARPAPSPVVPLDQLTPSVGPLSQYASTPLRLALAASIDPVRIRFHHPPRAALLFDLDSGRVLWRRNPVKRLAIASLTKMMTALLVADSEPPDARVLVTKEALRYKGSGVGVLPRGKRVKLETMLNGLLLPSGNDAAIALAQRVSGTVARFVARMNERAHALGLSCTRYSSPDGFEDAGNHSCAADLAVLARADLDNRRIARITRRRHAFLPFPIKGERLFLYNNNPLVRLGYPGITGLKTGYTDRAGRCLVATARRGHLRLGVVLLHSPDPATQARKLLDRGFRLAFGGVQR